MGNVIPSFMEMLRQTAEKTKSTIVVEGSPIQRLGPSAIAPSTDASAEWEKYLEQMALAYDYEIVRAKARTKIFLLKKRYTHPYDLPEVTLEECRMAAAEIKTWIDTLRPMPRPEESGDDPVLILLRSLSPEQMSALQKAELPFTALRPEQSDLVRRMRLYEYLFAPANRMAFLTGALEQVAGAELEERPRSKQPVIGFTGTWIFRNDPVPRQFFFQIKELNLSSATPAWELEKDDSPLLAATPKETEAYRKQGIARGVGTYLLKEAAEELTKQAATDGQAVFQVDAELADKTIAVAGLSRADSRDVFEAIATVYGLRVASQSEGRYQLKRIKVPAPTSLAELAVAVRRILPAPIARAAHENDEASFDAQTGYLVAEMETATKAGRLTPEEFQRIHSALARLQKSQSMAAKFPYIVGIAAAHRVRREFETRRNKDESGTRSGRVPVASLDEKTRRAIAVAYFMEALPETLSALRLKVPEDASQFDRVVLEGGYYQKGNQQMAHLSYRVLDPRTKKLGPIASGYFDVPVRPAPSKNSGTSGEANGKP